MEINIPQVNTFFLPEEQEEVKELFEIHRKKWNAPIPRFTIDYVELSTYSEDIALYLKIDRRVHESGS